MIYPPFALILPLKACQADPLRDRVDSLKRTWMARHPPGVYDGVSYRLKRFINHFRFPAFVVCAYLAGQPFVYFFLGNHHELYSNRF